MIMIEPHPRQASLICICLLGGFSFFSCLLTHPIIVDGNLSNVNEKHFHRHACVLERVKLL